ncbi:peptidase domain-containing ABC transporter [Vibrio sp. S9_S30]|uniref:peptidase domain-containing ABC transporter n=1 Tax=Vibrio sp. S9_S30 TaxID=2720226 RepID=UPI001EEF0CA2|nr:peptidase domain-containing ABC transporter [Vibrio sp. S9_S30]
MILNYHGNNISLSGLRKKHPQSLNGTNLENLFSICEKHDLSPRAVRIELESIDKLKTPCILHWDLDHFIVLNEVKNNVCTISDPALGERKIKINEVGKHFTGIALELTPTKKFERKSNSDRISILELFKDCHGVYSVILKMFIISIVLMLFSLVTPYYMRITLDEVIPSSDRNLAFILSFAFFLVLLFNIMFKLMRSFISIRLNYYLSDVLTLNLYKHLFSLPIEYFSKRHLGDVVSRFKSLNNIKQVATSKLVEIILDSIMSIITLLLMFSYDAILTMIVLISLSMYISFRLLLYIPLKRNNEELIIKSASENSEFMENVRGVQTIKLLSMSGYKLNKWHNLFIDSLNLSTKVTYMNSFFSLGRTFIFGIENIAIIYISTDYILSSNGNDIFTLGMLTAFIAYKSQFTGTAASLVDKLVQIRMLDIDLDRVSDIYLSESEQNLGVETPSQLEGHLSVKNLSFKYSGDKSYIFKNISFVANPGETIAIVGRSGCGKTTLIKSILKLNPHTEGEVLIDGININKYDIDKLRYETSSVMQGDLLFSGSIQENIARFSSDIDFDQVVRCAKIACIHDDIVSLPMGYHTQISDFGSVFSEGQKQRIYLARALYSNPKIIFLDEFSSNLDLKTETLILENLSKINIAKVIIAHRKEVINSASKIVTL